MRSTARRGMWAALMLLAAYHASLLGEGALAWPDEHLSLNSIAAVRALQHGHLREAAAAWSAWGSRPLEYLARTPAAIVQILVEEVWGLPHLGPRSLRIAAAQNVAVSFMLGFAFFRLATRVLSARIAALSTLAFALLASNQMWVRHLVPYDLALLLHLLAAATALEIPRSSPDPASVRRSLYGGALVLLLFLSYPVIFGLVRSSGLAIALALLGGTLLWNRSLARVATPPTYAAAVRSGLLSGAALAVYPGYYSFVLVVFLTIALGARRRKAFAVDSGSFVSAVVHGTGVALVVFACESLARIGGASYLGSARLLSSTITQGAFEEGFVFLGRWLSSTDTLAAVWILPAAGLGALALANDLSKSVLTVRSAKLLRVSGALLALYCVYGFQSAVLHRMAFTGRYARMYLPALILLAGYACGRAPRRLAAPVWGGAFCLSLASFGRFAWGYADVGYPIDLLYDHGIAYEDIASEGIVNEARIIPSYNLPVREMTAGAAYVTHSGDTRFAIVNAGFFDLSTSPVERWQAPKGATTLADRAHFLAWGPGPYEGYSLDRRLQMQALAPRIKVVRLPSE